MLLCPEENIFMQDPSVIWAIHVRLIIDLTLTDTRYMDPSHIEMLLGAAVHAKIIAEIQSLWG